MPDKNFGSLTKEPPLRTLDSAISHITPGMSYNDLLSFARSDATAHRDAPGLVSKRFLLVNDDRTIAYDYFLSLTKIHPIDSPFIRKVMYFLWAYRDDRIKRFICERIADPSGKWRPAQVTDKSNAEFFQAWLSPKAAKKARSNFEFFLTETGIFAESTEQIHLELEDGWLEHASIAAAQHEADLTSRDELLANPIKFLKARNLLGLINADNPAALHVSPSSSMDSDPLEDESIATGSLGKSNSYDWDRPAPTTSATAKNATFNVNVVARERANASHHKLEKILAMAAKKCGHAPKYNQNIDLYFDLADESVLAEIKSCTDNNFHAQVRKGISQLLEYKFLYNDVLKSKTQLLLLMETPPPKDKRWLIEYTSSMEIILAWKNPTSDELETIAAIPTALKKIVGAI